MLTLFRIDEKEYEFVESYDRINKSYVNVSSHKNNLFIYFEWNYSNHYDHINRYNDGRCKYKDDEIKEQNLSKLWKYYTMRAVYHELDDTTLYKYLPYYINTREQYYDFYYNDSYTGGILECIGYVLHDKNKTVRIINEDIYGNDIYIYYSLGERKIKIDKINNKKFQKTIQYYELIGNASNYNNPSNLINNDYHPLNEPLDINGNDTNRNIDIIQPSAYIIPNHHRNDRNIDIIRPRPYTIPNPYPSNLINNDYYPLNEPLDTNGNDTNGNIDIIQPSSYTISNPYHSHNVNNPVNVNNVSIDNMLGLLINH